MIVKSDQFSQIISSIVIKDKYPFIVGAEQHEEENEKKQAYEISYQNHSKVVVSLSVSTEEHSSIWRPAVSKS